MPIVDLDGVEDGDQGKNRQPRDHSRDYAGESIYPQVKAIRERLPAWSDGKLRIALDLHCPHIRGTHNEWIYFVGGPDEKIWKEVGRFSEILERVRTGPLPYKRENNLPFGQAWNKPANFDGRQIVRPLGRRVTGRARRVDDRVSVRQRAGAGGDGRDGAGVRAGSREGDPQYLDAPAE